MTALCDADMRVHALAWLGQVHADDPDTRCLSELSIPRPSARVDIAVINGEFCAVEIKSDRDTLKRLPRQIRSYCAVFDKAWAFTTPTHFASLKRIVPTWWGIAVLIDKKVIEYRKSEINPAIDLEKLLHILTKGEITAIAAQLELPLGRNLRNDAAIKHLAAYPAPQILHGAMREALKQRRQAVSLSWNLHPKRQSDHAHT